MRKTFSALAFSHFHDMWHFSPGLDTGEFVFFRALLAADQMKQFPVTPKSCSEMHLLSLLTLWLQVICHGRTSLK